MDDGIAFALLAAVVWGGYVFGLKRYFDAYPATVLTAVVNSFAILWYLPLAARNVDPAAVPTLATLTLPTVAVAVGTVLALAAALLLFLRALSAGEVSYVTPINKLAPAFVLPVELFLLGEHLTLLQLVGVVVATLAVYVANYRQGSLLDPVRRAARSRPAQLSLLSAALYGLSDVGKRVALSDLALQTEVWVLWVFGGVLLVILPGAVRDWNRAPDALFGPDLPKFAVAGLAVAVGEHVTSLAFGLVPASVASPIINTQAIVAVVLGGVVLRERAFATRLVAAALAVAGVTLIAV